VVVSALWRDCRRGLFLDSESSFDYMSSMKIEVVDGDLPAREWWESQRLRYNIGLAASGIMAFVLFAIILFSLPIEDFGTGLFGIITLGISYLFFMGGANACYLIGPLSERLIRPKDIVGYRRRAYGLGFWFSFAVPFLLPILQICKVIRYTIMYAP
jgi:hypothetical protein